MKKGDYFYRHEYGFDGLTFYKCTVVDVIEDDGNTLVVFKWFGRRKQRWFYVVETIYQIAFKLKNEIYTKTRQLNQKI